MSDFQITLTLADQHRVVDVDNTTAADARRFVLRMYQGTVWSHATLTVKEKP